jgi:hypothetical protein
MSTIYKSDYESVTNWVECIKTDIESLRNEYNL